MSIKNLSLLSLDSIEYCYLVSKQHYTNRYFTVRVPKLTPMLSGSKSTSKVSFNNSILANDSKCKPSLGNQLSTQNFITIRRASTCDLEHLADINGYIADGTRLRCMCCDRNPKDMLIIDG